MPILLHDIKTSEGKTSDSEALQLQDISEMAAPKMWKFSRENVNVFYLTFFFNHF